MLTNTPSSYSYFLTQTVTFPKKEYEWQSSRAKNSANRRRIKKKRTKNGSEPIVNTTNIKGNWSFDKANFFIYYTVFSFFLNIKQAKGRLFGWP